MTSFASLITAGQIAWNSGKGNHGNQLTIYEIALLINIKESYDSFSLSNTLPNASMGGAKRRAS